MQIQTVIQLPINELESLSIDIGTTLFEEIHKTNNPELNLDNL